MIIASKMNLLYKDFFFSYYKGSEGRDRCVINLNKLYQSQRDRSLFESKWQSFLDSDADNTDILSRTTHIIEYFTTSIIPSFVRSKPRLFLLFGNPVPHSVNIGAMFSAKVIGHEHRIWRFLSETGVLEFSDRATIIPSDPTWRVRSLLTKNYKSPFEIAMASFITFPSVATHPKWAGVAGVKRLFGAKAFDMLCDSEFERLQKIFKSFFPEKGIVVAFQKDAFTTLRSSDTPAYSLRSCFSGLLIGSVKENPNIFLGAAPPTRLIQSLKAKKGFTKIVKEGLNSC